MFFRIFLLCTLFANVFCEDDDCDVAGVKGKCVDIRSCPTALNDIKQRIKPKICSFNGTSTIPNVCCLSSMTNVDTHSTTPAVPDDAECPPLEERYKPKTKQIQQGHKAWAKCVEYQSTALFPCSERGRRSRCNRRYNTNEFGADEDDDTAGGGKSSVVKEFPHMALLGSGDTIDSADWFCGGSLISEKFVVTVAHCLSGNTRQAYAAFGVLRRSDERSSWDIHKIKAEIPHPEYDWYSKYNDIALLEMENIVQFSGRVMPACLHVGDEVADTIGAATGWGSHTHKGKEADIMHYVPLWKWSHANCSAVHKPDKYMTRGIDDATQVCYGDDGHYVRDTCQGDSGGPLQIISRDINCMYLVIALTAFGIECGQLGIPAVYTRVSHYVPWIESVVWP